MTEHSGGVPYVVGESVSQTVGQWWIWALVARVVCTT